MIVLTCNPYSSLWYSSIFFCNGPLWLVYHKKNHVICDRPIKVDHYKNHVIFFHTIIGTQRNQMPKNLHFFISYDVMLEYICAKKKKCRNVLKIANISRSDWNGF
jgi:hypothetical protein